VLIAVLGSQPAGDRSHKPGARLLLPRSVVTFSAAEHHRPLAGTKLYCLCLVTEARGCERAIQGSYAATH